MPGHDPLFLSATASLAAFPALISDGLLGYVGLGPGQEFIPYFLAMLGLLGGATIAVIQWPLAAFLGLFRRNKGFPGHHLTNTPPTTRGPETPGASCP
jgi:hypothetical protein